MAAADPVFLRTAPRLSVGRVARADLAGLVAVVLITALAVAVPLVAPHGPTESVGLPFGNGGLLGTDDLGRDVFSRVLYGMRTSWFSALAVVGIAVLIGGIVGLVAGVAGRWVDTVLMRLTDLMLALPGPVLAIAVIEAIGPGLVHLLLAVTVVWWPYYARIVRGEARAIAVRPHVDAARVAGVGPVRLVGRHIMPAVLPAVLVAASVDIGSLILTLAGLSFIGLGDPPPAPELGAMSAHDLIYLFGHPVLSLAPALAVTVLAFVANIAGDGLRNLLEDV